MARTNTAVKADPIFTHEGARAAHITPYQALRRSVLSCMLWENEFYEDGQKIADRIVELCKDPSIEVGDIALLAIEARNVMHLRHAPLLLLCGIIERGRGQSVVQDAIVAVIQRADELAELVSMYWRSGKRPFSAQMKRGLARAFLKFDAYALGKYDRAAKVKLKDVLFLCHAKPDTPERAEMWKKLIDGTLESPDTWEVNLSGGADKKATFERLLTDNKLGYLALLRNVRGMVEAGVDRKLLEGAIRARVGSARVLPFRYVAAARACPTLEHVIDEAMLAATALMPKLGGKTVVIVDVSGSMRHPLSAKSELTRLDTACALGAIAREMCESPAIYATAGNDGARLHQTALVPARRGMALVDAIGKMMMPLGGGGIFLKQVMDFIAEKEGTADRTIVITDEQDCGVGAGQAPATARLISPRNYLINVASAKNGVGYGRWTHLDGFSEGVLRWIIEMEGGQ